MTTPCSKFIANPDPKNLPEFLARVAKKAGADKKVIEKMKVEGESLVKASKKKVTVQEPKKSEKSGKKGVKNLVIILDYSNASHAIVAEDGGSIETILSTMVKTLNSKAGKNVLSKSSLSIGPGYLLKDKNWLKELEKGLNKLKVEYRSVEKDDFYEERGLNKNGKVAVRKATKTKATTKGKTSKSKKTSSSDDESESSSDSEKEDEEASSPEVPSKPVLKKNSKGNMEETNSSVVFESLPVGAGGRNIDVAVGVQAKRKGEGLETVDPLTEDAKNICQENHWKIINPSMITNLEKIKHKKLSAIKKLVETPEEEEEDDKSSSEVEEDDNNDEEEDGEEEDGSEAEESD